MIALPSFVPQRGSARGRAYKTAPPGGGLSVRAKRLAVVVALALGGVPAVALANDTSTELDLGGLVFTKNDAVAMEAEDLRITPETVRVRYRFRNTSTAPVTLTVAFPLPDLDFSDPNLVPAIPGSDPLNFVGFRTEIDGKPVSLAVMQKAVLGTRDVTSVLRGAGLSVVPLGSFQTQLEALDDAARARLVGDGLLVEIGTNEIGRPLLMPRWTVRTTVLRKQVFAPGQPVTVEHRYRTSVGLRQDTPLRKSLRQAPGMEDEVQRYRDDYCIDDGVLMALDKLAGGVEGNSGKLRERRINYILKTGANWAGPIKDFHIVIDKGHSDRVASFCLAGVRKVSATTFEMHAQDFTPDRDLRILLIERF